MTLHPLTHLSIHGFQSIVALEQLELRDINILIGPNGAGKSNFVNYFRMIRALIQGNLQTWIAEAGGADRIVSYGVKETSAIHTTMTFGEDSYHLELKPTANDQLIFSNESVQSPSHTESLGRGHTESTLKQNFSPLSTHCYDAIAGWQIYQFHDTSRTAGVKRYTPLNHHQSLAEDASNLAAFLYRMKSSYPDQYSYLRRIIQRAIPNFDDFVLHPIARTHPDNLEIRLEWKAHGKNYPLWPTQLSDGSLRFICLATALLQSSPPTTLIIDEPELGLHPTALGLLSGLIRRASATPIQIILATQSVTLLNEFQLEDIIITELKDGSSQYGRLHQDDFTHWLKEYSIGELWNKNILGGRP